MRCSNCGYPQLREKDDLEDFITKLYCPGCGGTSIVPIDTEELMESEPIDSDDLHSKGR